MNVFPIAPAESRYLWSLIPVTVLLLGVLIGGVGLLATSVRGAQASRFEIAGDGLRLVGDLYGRVVPKRDIRVDGARRVDLAREAGLQPKWRRIGTALPGYQAGWFRLRNGEKALLYLTDRTRAVYIPTTAGYSLLLSPADPDAFLSRLRAVLGSWASCPAGVGCSPRCWAPRRGSSSGGDGVRPPPATPQPVRRRP